MSIVRLVVHVVVLAAVHLVLSLAIGAVLLFAWAGWQMLTQ
jgi:hypothetical protein